jgi:twitching motility protein PilT
VLPVFHLVPKVSGGRVAVLEILKATLRTREYLEEGEREGKSLLDAMRDGELDGMQHFDGELEKLVRSGAVSYATALLHATNAGNLRVQLADAQPKEPKEVGGFVVTRDY